MFGYVRVQAPDLRVREHEAYRATYCGLCRAMGKCTGQCSRMTLSYDFAFLALVRLALTEESFSFARRRCLVHPLKKRSVMERNEALDYCARASAVLAYHKTQDDICDERGAKRLMARAADPFLRQMQKKAVRADEAVGELDGAVQSCLSSLTETEAARLPSVDTPADIFGELLGRVAAAGLEGDRARIAYRIGWHVGRWIYIVDALDDYEEDVRRGRYNPFALAYPDPEALHAALDGIADALKNELMGAESALDLLDITSETHRNILYNILYLGMPGTVERVLASVRGEEKESGKETRSNDGSL